MVKDKLMTKGNSKIYSIYFFYGPEDYLIHEEVQRLLDQTLSQKERGLNLHLFNGDENNSQEIIQTAQTIPMFSPYRFVLVRYADQFNGEEIGKLLKYIQNPSPNTCLVMCGQTLGLWKGHRAEIEKAGKVIEYPRLKGKGLISWIRKRMEKGGKTLTEEAAEYMVEVIGDHLYDLENGLEKIFLSVGAKKRVELIDVEGITSEVKVNTVFDLTNAIGQRNLEKALGILEKAMESRAIPFKKEGEVSKKRDDPAPLLLSMMAKQYWNILRVKEMISSRQELGEVAIALQLQTWNVKKLIDQGESFSKSFLQEGILRCYETDLAIKMGRGPKNLLMEKLIIDLCCPQEIH
jgi:DNA polymerase-3 subunit delta